MGKLLISDIEATFTALDERIQDLERFHGSLVHSAKRWSKRTKADAKQVLKRTAGPRWSATQKKAISKRMKAYWAARKRSPKP